MKTILKNMDSTWTPQCVHYFVSTGDLLVKMWCQHEEILQGKVIRYDRTGQLTQTIKYHDSGEQLYYGPNYITENINGDVVVSDWKLRVVVTTRGGRQSLYLHRGSHGISEDAIGRLH